MANNNKNVCSMKPLDILMYVVIAYLLYVIIAQKPIIPKEMKGVKKAVQPVTKAVEPITKPIAKAVKPAGSVIQHAGSTAGTMGNSAVQGVEAMQNKQRREAMQNKRREGMQNKIEGYSTSSTKYANF